MKKILCFSAHDFEMNYLQKYADHFQLELSCTDKRLDIDTVHMACGFQGVLCWASDDLSKDVLKELYSNGSRFISLRSAGFSHLDIKTAQELKLRVTRVPSYSPESIAEHAVALYLNLNRKINKAYQRVKDFNFSLHGLVGEQVFGKTVGVIGNGHIGQAFIRIMLGFGCKVLIYDPHSNQKELQALGKAEFVELDVLFKESDVISLHCPHNVETHHIINENSLKMMKPNCTLINTGRGGLVDTKSLIYALKKKMIAAVALDVYEFEEKVFFHDLSESGIEDDELARLVSFPNVLITSHQAFFTKESLENIAHTSIENLSLLMNEKNPVKENILL